MFFTRDDRKNIEKILETQNQHTTQLAVYNESLKEHMRRSDLLEREQQKITARVLPIENHVLFVDKLVKGLITLITATAGIGAVIHYFFSK